MKNEKQWLKFAALVEADCQIAFTFDTMFLDDAFRVRNLDGSRVTDVLPCRSVFADPVASFDQIKKGLV